MKRLLEGYEESLKHTKWHKPKFGAEYWVWLDHLRLVSEMQMSFDPSAELWNRYAPLNMQRKPK